MTLSKVIEGGYQAENLMLI